MTIHTPLDDEGCGDSLAATLYLLAQARDAVMGHLKQLEHEGAVDARTFGAQVKDLRDVLKLVVTESQNVAKLRRDAGGLVPGGVFDLEAARAEIGLRLACLRDAEGGG
jgi:hypothetical protein